MSASGEKTMRGIRLLLNRIERPPLPPQGNGMAGLRSLTGARATALLAALLFAFAAWLPWLTVTYSFSPQAQPFAVDGGSLMQALPYLLADPVRLTGPSSDAFIRLLEIVRIAWSAVSAAGVLIAPFLWRRPRARSTRLAFTLYGLWLLVAAGFSLAGARVVFFPSTLPARTVSSGIQWSAGWGIWLALLSLTAGAFALATLIRYDLSSPRILTRPSRVPIIRTRVAWLGLGLLTLGMLLWGLGFMAIPWATVNCPTVPLTINHFVSGSCAALDSGDALSYLATRDLPRDAWNVAGGIYPLYGLLVGGGVLLLLALWRTTPSRIVCAWATLWLLGASAIAYLCYRGVGIILTANPVLSAQARGTWVGSSGVTTTLLGLLIAWLGIIALERAAVLAPPPAAIEPPVATQRTPLRLLLDDDDELEITSLR